MTQTRGQHVDLVAHIRLATSVDAAIIARLMEESFAQYRELYTVAGYRAIALSDEQIIDRMKEGPVWVALVNERIDATVAVVGKAQSLYLRGMAVRPSARGQHLGKLLLNCIERFATREGFERMFLSTTPFLDRAIRLYEGFGFKRTDEGPHDLHGTPLFTMEKITGQPRQIDSRT